MSASKNKIKTREGASTEKDKGEERVEIAQTAGNVFASGYEEGATANLAGTMGDECQGYKNDDPAVFFKKPKVSRSPAKHDRGMTKPEVALTRLPVKPKTSLEATQRGEMTTEEGRERDKRKRQEEEIVLTDTEESEGRESRRSVRTESLSGYEGSVENIFLLGDTGEDDGEDTSDRPAKKMRGRKGQEAKGETPKWRSTKDEMNRLGAVFEETRVLAKKIHIITKDLNKWVGANPNTKVEIKKGIGDLSGLVERLALLEGKMVVPMKELTKNRERNVREIATQTVGENKQSNRKAIEQEEEMAENIEDAIRQGGGLNEFTEIAHLKWPQRCFKKVKAENRTPFQMSREWDIATMVAEDFDMGEGGNKTIRDHYQGVDELKQQEVGIGGVAYLVEQLQIPGKGGEMKASKRHVYYGVVAERATDTWNLEGVFETVTKIRDLMRTNERRKIAVAAVEKINRGYLKKMLEFIFADEDVEVIILTNEGESRDRRDAQMKSEIGKRNESRRRKDEAVIVRATEGKQYADLLKEMRKEVDIEGTGVKLTGIKKMKRGDILMTVQAKPGTSQAEALKHEIQRKMAGTQVQVTKEKEVVVHVTGMDAVTEEEELREAVKDALGQRFLTCGPRTPRGPRRSFRGSAKIPGRGSD